MLRELSRLLLEVGEQGRAVWSDIHSESAGGDGLEGAFAFPGGNTVLRGGLGGQISHSNVPTADMGGLYKTQLCLGNITRDTQCQSHQYLHAKQPDFKLLFGKKWAIPVLDIRSQWCNAFQL